MSGTERRVGNFFRTFKQYPKEVQREARPMLRQTASEPTAQIQRNASWSDRIPGAVRVGLSFSKRFQGVTIRVKSQIAPHAQAYEHKGKPGSFRHRVFGQNVWVNEPARPFFYEVAEEWHNRVTKDLGTVVDRVTRRHGFK